MVARIGVDKNGYVLEVSKIGHIQSVYKKAIRDVVSNVCKAFPKRVHSLYVYGSIARGTAKPYTSDIDVTVVLTSPVTAADKKKFDDLSEKIQKNNPILYKVDFDPGSIKDFLAKRNLYSWGFWLKHNCLCIFGDDLGKKLPRLKISKKIGKEVNKSFPVRMKSYRTRVNTSKSPAEVKVLCGEIMKRILRVGFCLIMEKEQSWTGDLEISYKLFSKHYPEYAKSMQQVLVLARTPSADKQKIVRILDTFGKWEVDEFRLVMGK